MKRLPTLVTFVLLCTNAFAQNIGIGTQTPDSKLQLKAASTDSVALKVSIDNNPKLKLSANGGLSVGTAEAAPANGLRVKGKMVVEDSIQSARPIYITSVSDSVVLQAGNTTIVLSANGAVKIKAAGGGGITIDGGTGDVTLKGANVNINANNNTNINAYNVAVKASSGGSFLTNGTLSLAGDLATALYSNNGEVNIKGYNVNTVADSIASIKGMKNLSLTAPNGAATLSASGGGVTVSGLTATLNSTAGNTMVKGNTTTLLGLGQTIITGPLITLGNGSGNYFPAARKGDVVAAPGGSGTIVSGSGTVLIQ